MDTPGPEVRFQCNICGRHCLAPVSSLGRETPSCSGCGSTLRMRSVMALLSRELFGRVLPISDFPRKPRLRGIGLSDWDEYALRLAKVADYTNTYYHQAPRLDITEIGDELAGSCDFLVSTDVFEHVAPPVSRAFAGARRLLKPGGLLVLTVPYALEFSHTLEHFPELHQWRLEPGGPGGWRLHNTRRDGTREVFEELVFHGGPGTTLEMRLFSRDSLLAELRDAGFRDVRIAGEDIPEAGVHWPCTWSLPVLARA